MSSPFDNLFTKQIILRKTRSVRRATLQIHKVLHLLETQGAESFKIDWDEDRKRIIITAFQYFRSQYPGTKPKTKPESAKAVFDALVPARYHKKVNIDNWGNL